VNARRFSKVLRDLARVPSQATAAIARDLNKEIQRNFDRGVDPYGRKWRTLAKSTLERGRHPPPLTDTGHGRASVVVKPGAGAGLVITIGVIYMLYHQFGGASHLRGPGGSYRLRRRNKNFGRDADRSPGRDNPPKRSFLPFDRMPSKWLAIITRRITEQAQRVARGR
jgi:phage gpG-like protein